MRIFRHDHWMLLVVMIATVFGLSWLSQHVTHPAAGGDHGGIIVESDLTEILIPEVLVQMARDPSSAQILESRESLRRFLEERGEPRAWLAVVWRTRSGNGQVVTMPSYCYPGEPGWDLPQIKDVMATVAGNPPVYPTSVFRSARILILPSDRIDEYPPDVIAEMTNDFDVENP